MRRAKLSALEREKAEVAGGVMLRVLRPLPKSATAHILRELIDAGVSDPVERALFDFLGGADAEGDTAPVMTPRPPVLQGGEARHR